MRRWVRRAGVWIASLGLLGAAAQAQAVVRTERAALEARVEAMRRVLRDVPESSVAEPSAPPRRLAQWNNWQNWTNWNNWKNWGNWLNK